LLAGWPTNTCICDGLPYFHFYGNSGWYVMQSVESWNGRWPYYSSLIANQSSYQMWFSATAFGGTNYINTPVGAVSHVSEPFLEGVNVTAQYFPLWYQRKHFAIAAWGSRGGLTTKMQATGDPFVTK